MAIVRIFLLLIVGALFGIGTGPGRSAEPVTVFAASSLVDVLTAVEKAYEDKTGNDLRISFAASSALAHQIENGAPADVFVSANTDWVDYLIEKDFVKKNNSVDIAGNTLVLIAPRTGQLRNFERLADFDFAAWIGSRDRLALADPDHVPAGIYAKQALKTLRRWEAVEDRLAITDNVRAALLLVARNEVPLGIVYRTDAKASKQVRIVTAFPPETHNPIRYRAAKIGKQASPSAQEFWDFLIGPDAAAVFLRHGFVSFRR